MAVANASRHAPDEDVAAAILAGLRLIRSAGGRQAGLAGAAMLDDAIRDVLLGERLRRRLAMGREVETVPLPGPSLARTRRIATAILEDIAALCVGLQGTVPAVSVLQPAVGYLVGHLIARLGGVPDVEAVLSAIRDRGEGDDPPPQGHGNAALRIH